MIAKKRLIVVLVAAGVFAIWLLRPSSRWAEVTQPAPTPSVPQATQPTLVRSDTLPRFEGLMAPKPVVAAEPRGNVVVVAHGMKNNFLGSDMLIWHSDDQGNTWQPPQNLTNEAKSGEIRFDPWLETDRRGQWYFIYSKFSDGRPLLRRSKDAGETWSDALPIEWRTCDRPVLGVSPDGQWLAVASAMGEKTDNYPAEPLDRNDPDWEKKFKAAWHHYAGVFLSRDHGESWDRIAAPFDGKHAIPFAITIDNSEHVAAAWIVEGNGSQSVVTTSDDRGQTWNTTLLAENLQPDRNHPFNGARFPVLALDGRSGLHAAYVTAGATALMIRHTPDWKVWNHAKKLSSEAADEVRMAAIDACGSMVHVTWFERIGTTWHTYYRGSRDYGNTWSPRICLSQRIVHEEGTIANGFQIFGEDDQSSITDDGTGRAHAAWCMRGGTVAHAVIAWMPPNVSAEQKHEPKPTDELDARR